MDHNNSSSLSVAQKTKRLDIHALKSHQVYICTNCLFPFFWAYNSGKILMHFSALFLLAPYQVLLWNFSLFYSFLIIFSNYLFLCKWVPLVQFGTIESHWIIYCLVPGISLWLTCASYFFSTSIGIFALLGPTTQWTKFSILWHLNACLPTKPSLWRRVW